MNAAQNGSGYIKALFSELAAKEKVTERGQLPEFIEGNRGFMCSIYWNEDTLNYETRWCPNIEVMMAIADLLKQVLPTLMTR